MNAWTWTVFQLMTQAAINEIEDNNKQEIKAFVGDLLNNVSPLKKLYK